MKEQPKCEVCQSAITRIQNQIMRKDEELENDILKAVMTHHTVKKTMGDAYVYGSEIPPYTTYDGLSIKVPRRIGNLRCLKGATEEMSRGFRIGTEMGE